MSNILWTPCPRILAVLTLSMQAERTVAKSTAKESIFRHSTIRVCYRHGGEKKVASEICNSFWKSSLFFPRVLRLQAFYLFSSLYHNALRHGQDWMNCTQALRQNFKILKLALGEKPRLTTQTSLTFTDARWKTKICQPLLILPSFWNCEHCRQKCCQTC
jgi:hypothetical protein